MKKSSNQINQFHVTQWFKNTEKGKGHKNELKSQCIY